MGQDPIHFYLTPPALFYKNLNGWISCEWEVGCDRVWPEGKRWCYSWCLVKADGYKVALKFPWGDHQWSAVFESVWAAVCLSIRWSVSLPCPGTLNWVLSMEGHGDKVDCCAAAEIETCCNYSPISGKVCKYLLYTGAYSAHCSLKKTLVPFDIGFKILPLFPANVNTFESPTH